MRVAAVAGFAAKGKLVAGTTIIPCVLGPGGISCFKREGDGRTPVGSLPLLTAYFRADRAPRPASGLPMRPIRPDDGWCDDARFALYNRLLRLPFPGSHERLWRDDRLYDLIVVLGHNMHPARKGGGSAIFLHVQSHDRAPTAGCVAVDPQALRKLLRRIGPGTRIVIG